MQYVATTSGNPVSSSKCALCSFVDDVPLPDYGICRKLQKQTPDLGKEMQPGVKKKVQCVYIKGGWGDDHHHSRRWSNSTRKVHYTTMILLLHDHSRSPNHPSPD